MDSPLTSARPRTDPFPLLAEASDIAANHALDIDDLLRALAELVRKVVGYQLFAVLLADDDGTMKIRHSIGYRTELANTLRVKLGEGITGSAAETRSTVVANDVTTDPRYLSAIDAVRSEIAVPLVARGKLVGIIDLQSSALGAFGEDEQNLLELIASRFSLAIDAAELYGATVRKNKTLTALADIAHEFSSILNVDELLHMIAERMRGIAPFDALAIFLVDHGILRHHFGATFKSRVDWHDVRMGEGLVGRAAATGLSVTSQDTNHDPRYIAQLQGIRSEIAVPLILKGNVIGVLDLESDTVAAFNDELEQALMLLAPQIASAIENARLYEEVEQNQQRMQKDLAAARQVQQSLLPHCCPTFGGISIAARNLPATEVSGDFYDFITRDKKSIGIWSGDVSGKGAAAALYAALSSALLRTLAADFHDPAQLLAQFNTALLARQLETRYLAGIFAQWSVADRTMSILSAGQPRPLIRRGSTIETLDVGGIPLGLLPGSQYEQVVVSLNSGDWFITASDGIHEARNEAGKEYGDARLRDFVAALPEDFSTERIVSAILDDVALFSGRKSPADDQTVIAARVV